MDIEYGLFTWDYEKEKINIIKHQVDFFTASLAFGDVNRIIFTDDKNSRFEDRYFCIGESSYGIITVRFTMRGNQVRIIGAGYWRKGKRLYEEKNKIF
jgi:uncharacterized DUF497 family protein